MFQKPSNIIEAKGNPFKEQLLGVLRAVFETQQNVHRMPDIKPVTGTQPVRTPARVSHNVSGDRLIALACSTGGPKSLQSVIPFLPKEMNATNGLSAAYAGRIYQDHGGPLK